MRKYPVLLMVLLVGALVLSACAGGGGTDGTPISETPGVPDTGDLGTETFPTEGMGTEMPTEDLAVPTIDSGMATSMPTMSEPTSAATSTSQAGGVGTSQPTDQAGIPGTGSGELVELSEMMNFTVQDNQGNDLGIVTDYVVNVCEAHIAYLVVSPSGATGDGNVVLIPYQTATTLNGQLGAGVTANNSAVSSTPAAGSGGNLNTGGDTLVVNLGGADLATFPAITVSSLDMENVAWEAAVIDFWQPFLNQSLTTACPVPSNSGTAVPTGSAPDVSGTPAASGTGVVAADPTAVSGGDTVLVNKITLASALLNADLQEENGNAVGTIRDAVIIRNTGGILYYIAEAQSGAETQPMSTPTVTSGAVDGTVVPTLQGATVVVGTLSPNFSNPGGATGSTAGLIALPPGAVNVRHDGGQTVFYLLVQTDVATGSPAFSGDVDSLGADSDWFDYWSQYLPMTQADLQ